MKVLIVAEKKKRIESFLPAFRSKGFEARYLRLLKINLVSKHNLTLIKALEENIPKYDAIFLQARLSLAPFIEPLLGEFVVKKIYSNCRPGSYYVGLNEPYKFTTLALAGVPITKLFATGSSKSIESLAKKARYPVLAKSFKGTSIEQMVVLNSASELKVFLKSIKGKVDGFILHEHIEEPVITCVVIGEKVFAVKRKIKKGEVVDIDKGVSCKLSDTEKETAMRAAQTCGYDIAQVNLIAGNVFEVRPTVRWQAFNKICSETMEGHVAQFFAEQVEARGAKRTVVDDLKSVGDSVSKTIFSRFLK